MRVEGGRRARIAEVYRRLRAHQGPARWWPGKSPFEVCLGAILTQNTAWSNVEKALAVLRARGLLSYEALCDLPPAELAPLIRPSGCFNVKARRVRAFLDFLGREYGGKVEAMAGEGPRALRAKLLAVSGIGRETADSIALYAAGRPLFVIDAYTRRVFARLGLFRGDERLHGRPAPRRRALQRLPRAGRHPGQGGLPATAALRGLSARGRLRAAWPAARARHGQVTGRAEVGPSPAPPCRGRMRIASWGRHGFDGNNDPGRCRRSVLPAPKSGGKSQLPTITWLWLRN